MPLSPSDKRFLHTVDRMKMYILLIAIGVLIYLLLAPSSEIQMATSVIGLALCGVFWMTQQLLSFITQLDLELTRIVNALKRSLPPDQQKDFFRDA